MKIKNIYIINKNKQPDKQIIKIFCECGNKISYLEDNMYFCNECNKIYKRDIENDNCKC